MTIAQTKAALRNFRPSEFEIQTYAVQLLTFSAAPGVVWFAVPNGEHRSPRTGARLKKMGVRRGVADLCFVLPGGVSAFLELKSAGGHLSPEQRRFRDDVVVSGAKYAVAASTDEVSKILFDWKVVS